MKKRVLFVMPQYEIGGITVSLYSLLSKIDPERIEADIFAAPVGPYKGKMPNCTELPQNIWLSYPYIGRSIFIKAFQTIVYGIRYLLSKININVFPLIYKIGGKSIHSDKYDAVVCFSEGLAYSVSFFPARKKIQWIHCDYRRHLETNNPRFEHSAYQRYDKVVCVSDFVKGVFSEIYPEFANKTIAIHNVIDIEGIQTKAKDVGDLDVRFKTDSFTIISCGRLDPIKGFDRIPVISNQIKALTSRPFRWYIVGGGSKKEEKRIESEINKYCLEETVVLLGPQSNPYPYMAQADLYVCTSESESFPLVINEAKVLSVPIISNAFPSVFESIEVGVDGYVVPFEAMPEAIVDFINNPIVVPKDRIDNSDSLDAVYNLFEA